MTLIIIGEIKRKTCILKNERRGFTVVDIEDYERNQAEKKLLMKLDEAEEVVKDNEAWLSLDELKVLMED